VARRTRYIPDQTVSDLRIVLPREVRTAMIEHARRETPHECCGLLLGRGWTIDEAVPMPNVAATPATRFRVDERAHFELRRRLRSALAGREIVGAYHSHPSGPARPSARDIEEAGYPEWVCLIVGLGEGRTRVRGFTLRPSCRPIRVELR
jgi:proteasome lid subunit RPN8/RPN11